MGLTVSQKFAIDHITHYARNHKKAAKVTIQHIFRMSNMSEDLFYRSFNQLKKHAKIALHFHPDRPDQHMKSVAQALLEQGYYKNQFETLLSNGKLSPSPGGERDRWENRLFGGAYQTEGINHSQRPKYGALHVMLHPDGPAPRFGSCYFLLSPKVSFRSTFTYLDSHQEPKERGTYEEFDMIWAALLEETFLRDFAIGEANLTPAGFIDHLLNRLHKPILSPANQEAHRNLNHYIEAQVHGDVSLKDDVVALVADPSFKGTRVGVILEQICETYSVDLHWHMGFALLAEDVPDHFRGPAMPSLAKRIAIDGIVDARAIGLAAMEVKRHPTFWSNRGTPQEVLQELKFLWHVLVKYGRPLKTFI